MDTDSVLLNSKLFSSSWIVIEKGPVGRLVLGFMIWEIVNEKVPPEKPLLAKPPVTVKMKEP